MQGENWWGCLNGVDELQVLEQVVDGRCQSGRRRRLVEGMMAYEKGIIPFLMCLWGLDLFSTMIMFWISFRLVLDSVSFLHILPRLLLGVPGILSSSKTFLPGDLLSPLPIFPLPFSFDYLMIFLDARNLKIYLPFFLEPSFFPRSAAQNHTMFLSPSFDLLFCYQGSLHRVSISPSVRSHEHAIASRSSRVKKSGLIMACFPLSFEYN